MELEKVLVIDPVTNVEETYKTKEVVYKSNVNTSLYNYTADAQSETNVIFNNITPPSLNTIINRCLKLKYQLTVAVTGSGEAQPTLLANAICGAGPFVEENFETGISVLGNNSTAGIVLADSPLQTSCTAIELRINGSSTSISPNDYIQLYGHMASKDDLNMFSTTYPHQKDNMAVYFPSANDELNFRSPFQQFNANTDLQSRASTVWTLSKQAGGVDTYTVDVMEDLYLSPMVWGELGNKCAGLSNINNLTLNIRIANLNRAVRIVTAAANANTNTSQYFAGVSDINVTFGGANARNAVLELQYITPDPVLAAKMPSVLAYDYDYLQSFISSGSAIALTNSSKIIFQSIRLPSIPKRIYVYAKPSKNVFSSGQQPINTVPDYFLPITNVKVTFNNRINLLANDIPETLYNKSVANGLKDSFYEWQYGCGSIMIIDVAKDLGLEADESVGQANKYSTLQIEATFSNTNLTFQGVQGTVPNPNPNGLVDMTQQNSYDYYILVESTGKAFITPSDCQFVLTGPSSAEVLALTSNMDKVVDQSDLDGKQVGGGAFGLGKLFKSGLNLIKNVDPEKVVDGLKGVQQTLGAMGLGVAGGAMKHRRVR
jgi:hypothetical protein